MLELAGISKSFGPVAALSDVTLTARPGEIHGLLGENGAGKSTLMNVLFGLTRPDGGSISIDGRQAQIKSPRNAQRLGIGMVHQHFKLVPTLSVLENFLLSQQHGMGLLRRRRMTPRLRELFDRLGWQIDPHARVETLSVGQQQRVEIAKALAGGGKVLILDEPTSVLTPQETIELFIALRTLARDGATIIFISHKLAEVRQVCQTVTILRRGHVVHTGAITDLTDQQMAEKMIGGPLQMPGRSETTPSWSQPPLLQLQNVMRRGRATIFLNDISLAVHSGQIVGIAGVDGNGQGPLVEAIVGTHRPNSGTIKIDGRDARQMGIRPRIEVMGYIPEDRHGNALILPLSVEQNMLLKDYRKPRFSTMGFLRLRQWRTHAAELSKHFDVRTASVIEPVGTLSGGNQQKVVVARELSAKPRIVIAVNPTRGLDVGATAFVLQQLLDARAAGAAVLLVHSDLDELLAISDRVLVMYNGTLRDSHWPETTKERIGQMMLGVA